MHEERRRESRGWGSDEAAAVKWNFLCKKWEAGHLGRIGDKLALSLETGRITRVRWVVYSICAFLENKQTFLRGTA